MIFPIIAPGKDAGCIDDSNCALTEACLNRVCINPCLDNPCARNAECTVNNHKSTCICPSGLIGNPFINCYQESVQITPECTSDYQCSNTEACINQRCENPCAENNPCFGNAECRVSNHRPLCSCPQGWGGDPKVQCYKRKYISLNVF